MSEKVCKHRRSLFNAQPFYHIARTDTSKVPPPKSTTRVRSTLLRSARAAAMASLLLPVLRRPSPNAKAAASGSVIRCTSWRPACLHARIYTD